MVAITKTPHLAPRIVLAVFVLLTGLAALLLLVKGFNLSSLAFAALVAAPLGLYAAVKRPLDFPLGLYILLIPFDNLLGTGSFGTLTKLLGIVAGLFLLLWVARRGKVALKGWPVLVLLALMVWMLASTLWAIDQGAALKIMPTYAGLMLLYIVITMMPISPTQYKRLLFLAVVGGVCAAAYGIHTFYRDPTFSQESPAMMRLIVQVGTNYIDPNHFADALLFPIAIITMWALRSRKILVKLACAAGLIVLVEGILVSASREGLSAILLIAGYYIWRSRYRLQLALAAAVVFVGAATTQTSIWLRFSTALQTGGSGRTSIWAVAVEAAKHRFLQGYGVGNFTQAFDLFYLSVHQPYPYGWESPAHNLLLHYLVELGVVGLALIALFFVAQFRSLREITVSSELYDYRIMMEAALLATATVSMTIDLFTYKYAWLVFAMIALLRNASSPVQASAPIRTASSSMMPVRSGRSLTQAFPESPMRRSSALSSEAS
jgi:O-antigen ligase